MEWLENFSKAIEYIESNLDKEISYDEIAKYTCCSTYYFQRIFAYIAGISVSEYIRRRRMTQAGFDLQRTNLKVLDIALKYGYNSPTSFNRAFQSVHGIPPIAAKENGSKLNSYPAMSFSIKVKGGNAMSYYIEEKESMRIVGIRTHLTEDMEENQKNIPLFWDGLITTQSFKTLIDMNKQKLDGILGVSVFENPQNIFYYIAIASDDPVPTGMYEYQIPASTWVVFENDGKFKEKIQEIFKRFYTEWLPFSGYEYAGLPDIEVYPISTNKPKQGHSEVWIAIRKKEK